ncbi:hypothetical protein MWN34_07935 [Ancylobacter sp. 6x-1]|uniref:Uncharacterized protein n=1 Tax=Ancylobacter crimeensis TaxID=2579147 RepID=A0ABT0DA60_9HYPH|nr:hypothetical protein [Ancylobacter crimeensis]MCK0196841.1 hypothetical protein [Ancylobacter crimeensis]
MLGRPSAMLADHRSDRAAEPLPEGQRLRCDMCGGRRVKLRRVASPAELVAFIAGRR